MGGTRNYIPTHDQRRLYRHRLRRLDRRPDRSVRGSLEGGRLVGPSSVARLSAHRHTHSDKGDENQKGDRKGVENEKGDEKGDENEKGDGKGDENEKGDERGLKNMTGLTSP